MLVRRPRNAPLTSRPPSTDNGRRLSCSAADCCILLLAFSASNARAQDACRVHDLAIQAALDDRLARYNLAVEFFSGKAVPRDLAKSAALWRLAANQGDRDASSNLGYLLFYGMGVDRDQKEAVRLWRIAADGGQSEAKLHLSRVYSEGAFPSRDNQEACARARAAELLSAASSEPLDQVVAADARAEVSRLRSRLSAQQRRAAEGLARKFAGSARSAA